MGGGQKNVHHPWPLALSTLLVSGVVNELLWVAAKRTFTVPGPWPLKFSHLPFLLALLLQLSQMADTGATLAHCAELRRRARRPTAFDGGGDGLGGARLGRSCVHHERKRYAT